jgi:hypothetical protein
MKNFIVLVALLGLTACSTVPPPPPQPQFQPPPPPPPPTPVVQPFADNKTFMLVRPMEYEIFDSNETVVVPTGFVTDLASAPQGLWSLGVSPHGTYSRAAIIHDYLYWSQVCTREQADNIMLLAMIESGVSSTQQFLMYRGVDFGGNFAWIKNKADREKGLPRIIPEELWGEIEPNMTWAQWEKELVRQNVKDPVFPKEASYCRLGSDEYVEQQSKTLEAGD